MPHVLVNGPASWNTLIRLPALPDPRSQTLFASSHHDGLGGTSAGKALTLAALGVDVTLRTAIGDDGEGSRVRAALAHPRILLVVQEVAATERHVNLMADDGARVSLYLELPSPGPGPVPSLDGVDAAVLDLADHSRPLLTAARAAGVPVWCDVHDDDGLADYPRDFAAAADVLLVSAARLTDPRAYLSGAVARGCRLAVCTDGGNGALALDADGWIEVPAAPVADVVDTNGAGDAFLAGLLSGVLDDLPVEAALARASAAGATAVTTRDLGAPAATVPTLDVLAATVPVRRV
ncbi:carbohydrate kinase family protein [Cellulomonas humilata]|uniref:Sugar/nucleoside kinase (Ribokinase family) n=1 Tax=Cellulomonas humilata TaxID=144055 RepID=A0ABU0EDY4_9CELL|nr:carbohydrate kinase family protein [Cellulomonas humilata]MDQ0373488.1 sugar/nucleoside kinase (ribokinase family) [Cellulomonas humilata]